MLNSKFKMKNSGHEASGNTMRPIFHFESFILNFLGVGR